jgi:hypothetical protein
MNAARRRISPIVQLPPTARIIADVTGVGKTFACGHGIAVVGCALLLTACVTEPGIGYIGGWDQNVSDEAELWGGYSRYRVYELREDVFVLNGNERTNGAALTPGIDAPVPPGTFRAPTTVEEYLDNPRYWREVDGIVERGTRVRAEILRGKGNLRDRSVTVHYVKGRVLNGPFQGELLDMEPLSRYRTDIETGRRILVGPNGDFLTPVT